MTVSLSQICVCVCVCLCVYVCVCMCVLLVKEQKHIVNIYMMEHISGMCKGSFSEYKLEHGFITLSVVLFDLLFFLLCLTEWIRKQLCDLMICLFFLTFEPRIEIWYL